MTNEAGLEFNRCKWRAEKGTVSQENGAAGALERLAKDIFDFTVERDPIAIQKDIDILKTSLQLSLKNTIPEKQDSLSGADERQAALDDLKAEWEFNGAKPYNWFIRDHYDVLVAALQSPRVPVIDGLDEAIASCVRYPKTNEIGFLTPADRDNVLKAARAYAELQKGV